MHSLSQRRYNMRQHLPRNLGHAFGRLMSMVPISPRTICKCLCQVNNMGVIFRVGRNDGTHLCIELGNTFAIGLVDRLQHDLGFTFEEALLFLTPRIGSKTLNRLQENNLTHAHCARQGQRHLLISAPYLGR